MPDHPSPRECKRCGRRIWILPGADNKDIPLDMGAPVFFVEEEQSANTTRFVAHRAKNNYVSHFATCPNQEDKP